MPSFDELLKKDHVKNHALFKQREQRIAQQRRNRKLYAQAFDSLEDEDDDLNDMFSKQDNGEEKDPTLPNLIRSAVRATEGILHQFNFPIYPKVSYNNTKNVKYASHDPGKVVEGFVVLNCQIKTLNGLNRTATISVRIDRSQVVPPSVLELDGRLYTLGQAAIDEVVERGTSYETEELRDMFDPPLVGDERVMAVENKHDIGYIPRNSGNIFDVSKRGRVSDLHGAYKVVTDAMKEAAENGEDTFPRQWSHLAEKYILPVVDSASPDVWMNQLINDGFCISPYGSNRGRPTTANKKAQNYDWVTDEMFAEKLEEIVEEDGPSFHLAGDVYSIVSEALNNEVLESLDEADWDNQEAFDLRLRHIVDNKGAANFLAIPGVYEELSEELNNEILSRLEDEREEDEGEDEGEGYAGNRVDELVESWIKGNRKWVVSEIAESPDKMALFRAVYSELSSDDKEVFVVLWNNAMSGRVNTSKKAQFDDGPYIVDLPRLKGKIFDSYEDAYEVLKDEYWEDAQKEADRHPMFDLNRDASVGDILDNLAKFIKKAQVLDDEEILDSMDIEPRLYPETKTPMEAGDKVKFNGADDIIRGKIVEIDPQNDYLIVESKGIRYQVHCEDITATPSTFQKMWK